MLPAQSSTDFVDQGLSVEATLTELHEQINQLYCVNGANLVDWLCVEQIAADLLGAGVKHFQAMAYWGVARLHNQGFTALADSAELLTQWVEHHWEQALPPVKRLRGRLSAIEWWLERSTTWIQQFVCGPLEAAVCERAIETVTAFDRVLAAQCDSPPMMAPLISLLKQLELILPPPEEPAAQEVIAEAEGPVTELASPENAAVNQTDSDVECEPARAAPAASMPVDRVPEAVDPLTEPPESALLASKLQGPSMAYQSTEVTTLQAVIDRSLKAMAEVNYQKAIELLQQGQKQLMGAERLQLTCQLADRLREIGCVTLASVQIQQALTLVEQHQLESWDPPLAQQVLESAFDLLSTIGNSEQASEILGRLCLLDAGRAFRKLSTA